MGVPEEGSGNASSVHLVKREGRRRQARLAHFWGWHRGRRAMCRPWAIPFAASAAAIVTICWLLIPAPSPTRPCPLSLPLCFSISLSFLFIVRQHILLPPLPQHAFVIVRVVPLHQRQAHAGRSDPSLFRRRACLPARSFPPATSCLAQPLPLFNLFPSSGLFLFQTHPLFSLLPPPTSFSLQALPWNLPLPLSLDRRQATEQTPSSGVLYSEAMCSLALQGGPGAGGPA